MDDYALHLAASSDIYLPRVRELLAGGMDPNKKNNFGNTPLHVAAMSLNLNISIVRELLNAGADPNLTNNKGYAPLHYASVNKNLKMIKTLLQAGVDINTRTASGNTALHLAVNSDRFQILRGTRFYSHLNPFIPDMALIRLLCWEDNIDLDVIGVNGETPLMWAVADRQTSVVKVLLSRGANPNASNAYSETPLHKVFAMENPCNIIVDLLLRHGADICALDHENRTPIDNLVDGLGDDKSLLQVKLFVKMITFHKKVNKQLEIKLGNHAKLSVYQKRCSVEVEQMNTHIISCNLTIYDFILNCFNESHFQDLFLDIYKPLVDILVKEDYSIFMCDILRLIEKSDLLRVLEHNLQLQNGIEDSSITERIEFLKTHLYLASHLEIFDLVLKSNEFD